jgi:hypothetical protein
LAACSSSTASERSSDMPDDVIVANWRENTARSRSVVRLPRPGIVRSLRSSEPLDSEMDSGTSPCWRRIWAAAASLDASTRPFVRLPRVSKLVYSKLLAIVITTARRGA